MDMDRCSHRTIKPLPRWIRPGPSGCPRYIRLRNPPILPISFYFREHLAKGTLGDRRVSVRNLEVPSLRRWPVDGSLGFDSGTSLIKTYSRYSPIQAIGHWMVCVCKGSKTPGIAETDLNSIPLWGQGLPYGVGACYPSGSREVKFHSPAAAWMLPSW